MAARTDEHDAAAFETDLAWFDATSEKGHLVRPDGTRLWWAFLAAATEPPNADDAHFRAPSAPSTVLLMTGWDESFVKSVVSTRAPLDSPNRRSSNKALALHA